MGRYSDILLAASPPPIASVCSCSGSVGPELRLRGGPGLPGVCQTLPGGFPPSFGSKVGSPVGSRSITWETLTLRGSEESF